MGSKRALLNMPNNQLIQSQFEQFVQNITDLRVSLRRLDEINKKYNVLDARTGPIMKQDIDERSGSDFNPKQNLIFDQRSKIINICESSIQDKTLLKKFIEQDFESAKSSSTVPSDISEFDSNASSQGDSAIIKSYPNLKLKASSGIKKSSNINSNASLLQRSSGSCSKSNSEVSSTTSGSFTISEEDFLESSFFIRSNFFNVPPTLNFVLIAREDAVKFRKFTRLLRWKNTPITPKIVKNCLRASGFRETVKPNLWLCIWGKSLKDKLLRDVKFYQKVSHFPGIFEIGRKDYLNMNLKNMKRIHGKEEFDFFPQTFLVPNDWKVFKATYFETTCKKWIIKPPASARGTGIYIVTKLEEIPRKKKLIIQKYISNPFLINGKKFDLRIYVYITSFDPLRIYMYKNGLARFATARYSNKKKNLQNKFIHLTNFSINRYNDNSNQAGQSESVEHKWSLTCLWEFFEKNNINSAKILENIKDIIIKTVISCEGQVTSKMYSLLRSNYCCHELLGFDILLDENLKPWLLEVNISPSLNSTSKLDVEVKAPLVKDIFNTAGFRVPRLSDIYPSESNANNLNSCPTYCMDTRLSVRNRTADEKAKQSYFCRLFSEEKSISSILNTLTRCDINVLVETIDEHSRCGNLEALFPNKQTSKYLKYFETPRYYTLLLNEWLKQYSSKESQGILLLNKLCKTNLHLTEFKPIKNSEWIQAGLDCS